MTDQTRIVIPVVPIAQPRSALAQVELPSRGAGTARPDGARRSAR